MIDGTAHCLLQTEKQRSLCCHGDESIHCELPHAFVLHVPPLHPATSKEEDGDNKTCKSPSTLSCSLSLSFADLVSLWTCHSSMQRMEWGAPPHLHSLKVGERMGIHGCPWMPIKGHLLVHVNPQGVSSVYHVMLYPQNDTHIFVRGVFIQYLINDSEGEDTNLSTDMWANIFIFSSREEDFVWGTHVPSSLLRKKSLFLVGNKVFCLRKKKRLLLLELMHADYNQESFVWGYISCSFFLSRKKSCLSFKIKKKRKRKIWYMSSFFSCWCQVWSITTSFGLRNKKSGLILHTDTRLSRGC